MSKITPRQFYGALAGFTQPLSLCKPIKENAEPEKQQPTSNGHPHADLMMQYAEIAKTNPEPWKELEYSVHGKSSWLNFDRHPIWEAKILHFACLF